MTAKADTMGASLTEFSLRECFCWVTEITNGAVERDVEDEVSRCGRTVLFSDRCRGLRRTRWRAASDEFSQD